MTEEQRLKEQAVAIRLWDSFSLEQKKTVTKVYSNYKAANENKSNNNNRRG